jgi:hypothetical protein
MRVAEAGLANDGKRSALLPVDCRPILRLAVPYERTIAGLLLFFSDGLELCGTDNGAC